jgi:LysM repeat protein
MSHRSPARYLAPLALVAFALALVVVLGSSRSDDSSSGGGDSAGRTTTTERKQDAAKTTSEETTTPGEAEPAASSYTIKAGDTLSTISEKTGVPVDTLLSLNPDIDPQALTTGQRLKLKQ